MAAYCRSIIQVDLLPTLGPVTVDSGGKLGGTGAIAGHVSNGGVVAPAETLDIGSYSQTSGGSLDIEIATLLSYDQLLVSGMASLDGTLHVTLDGYKRHAGDTFTILTSSGLSGNFSSSTCRHLVTGFSLRRASPQTTCF